MKKILAVLLMVSMVMLFGCGGGGSTPSTGTTGTTGTDGTGGTVAAKPFTLSVIAGDATNTSATDLYTNIDGYADGYGSVVQFNKPGDGVIIGNTMFISDTVNDVIRAMDLTTKVVQTYAGAKSSSTGGLIDGPRLDARFNAPVGLATDGTDLYVADNSNHAIRKITLATGLVSTVAAGGGYADGPVATAKFASVDRIICVGTALYVTDISVSLGAMTIRKIDLVSKNVTTFRTYGAAQNNSFSVTGFATDGTNLYLAQNEKISKINLVTDVETPIAGHYNYITSGGDGIGSSANFYGISSLALNGNTLYVADYGRVREINLTTTAVTTRYNFDSSKSTRRHLIMDATAGNLYITHLNVLGQLQDL